MRETNEMNKPDKGKCVFRLTLVLHSFWITETQVLKEKSVDTPQVNHVTCVKSWMSNKIADMAERAAANFANAAL